MRPSGTKTTRRKIATKATTWTNWTSIPTAGSEVDPATRGVNVLGTHAFRPRFLRRPCPVVSVRLQSFLSGLQAFDQHEFHQDREVVGAERGQAPQAGDAEVLAVEQVIQGP